MYLEIMSKASQTEKVAEIEHAGSDKISRQSSANADSYEIPGYATVIGGRAGESRGEHAFSACRLLTN